jgi:hypothetical protein
MMIWEVSQDKQDHRSLLQAIYDKTSEYTVAPQAPVVVMSPAGNDLELSWEHESMISRYEVWRGTDPYFSPGDPGTLKLDDVDPPDTGSTVTYTDIGAGEAPVNYFYLIRALNAIGEAVSNSVAKFSFSLQPGEVP